MLCTFVLNFDDIWIHYFEINSIYEKDIGHMHPLLPFYWGLEKRNIEKEGGPRIGLFYYCTLQFTKWRSNKPLLHDFELICHIRET